MKSPIKTPPAIRQLERVVAPATQIRMERVELPSMQRLTRQERKTPARLLFGLDATASRQVMWQTAVKAQAGMFQAIEGIGGLEVSLAWFGGSWFRHSQWTTRAIELAVTMAKVKCDCGGTQIIKLLHHAELCAREGGLAALVFVGDCFEENRAEALEKAHGLALLGVRGFFFQDKLGHSDSTASQVYPELAATMHGAYDVLNEASGAQLRALLGAVAVYAAGGERALEAYARQTTTAQGILRQLERYTG